MSKKALTVQAVAALSGVTVRALHHYDEIGLLTPTRGESGYRHYSDADVVRLQQILVYRALGLPLQQIKSLMDDPEFDAAAALEEQRAQLEARAAETAQMLESVDRALARLRGDPTPELADLFEGFDPAAYEEEAERRWGDTSAYAESRQRTSQYSKDDWVRIKADSDAILERVATAVEAGTSARAESGRGLAEAYRLHIDRYYYPCSRAMYREVASMYTSDARFRENLERYGAGVAECLALAAVAKAE